MVRAELTESGTPLPFIPAARIGVDLGYTERSWDAGVQVVATSDQTRTPDFLTPTAGFTMVGASIAPGIWEVLLEQGQPLEVVPMGLGARNTLRLEAAMPLYGHELSEDVNPFEAGLGFACHLVGYDFPGGAHGTMISNEFSLKGYSPQDTPVLYFNYWADTDDQNYPFQNKFDQLRVMVAGNDGNWTVLATNVNDNVGFRLASSADGRDGCPRIPVASNGPTRPCSSLSAWQANTELAGSVVGVRARTAAAQRFSSAV